MNKTLPELTEALRSNRGARKGGQLAYEIKIFLWAKYDPNDELIYPVIDNWDVQLAKTISKDAYGTLSRDEVLSILFGIIHRSRVAEGLWRSMCERGVTYRLLEQLLVVDSDKY